MVQIGAAYWNSKYGEGTFSFYMRFVQLNEKEKLVCLSDLKSDIEEEIKRINDSLSKKPSKGL